MTSVMGDGNRESRMAVERADALLSQSKLSLVWALQISLDILREMTPFCYFFPCYTRVPQLLLISLFQ
jgi:hypothetical protein